MATQRAKRAQPRQQATSQATQHGTRVKRRTSAHTARAGGVSEWEAWLAQFRPEARALMDLMIEVNCRLAREAIQLAAQA